MSEEEKALGDPAVTSREIDEKRKGWWRVHVTPWMQVRSHATVSIKKNGYQ
jgi:hypothetical protein